IRDFHVTRVQTCALPIFERWLVCRQKPNVPFTDGFILHKPLYDQMHEKLNKDKNYTRFLTKRRRSTVELVLGTLINHHNMKRINSRGMKQAHKHVLMAALTYNLKKYLRFVVKKPSVVAQVISLKLGEVYCFLKTHLHELKNSFLSHSNFSILNYN